MRGAEKLIIALLLGIFCLVPAVAAETPQNQDYSSKLISLFDVNHNGQIETEELINISQAVINFHAEEPDLRFDITGDDKVSSQDFDLIMNFAQSFSTEFEMAMKALNETSNSVQS